MDLISIPLNVTNKVVSETVQAADKAFSAIVKPATEGMITSKIKQTASIYDIAEPMLDLSSVIYAFIELRRQVKKRLCKFAKEMKLILDEEDLFLETNGLAVLKNAIISCAEKLKAFKASDTTNGYAYHKSVKELEVLRDRYNLSDGDVQLLDDYIQIVFMPKTAEDMKADFRLHSEWMTPFLLAFGGEDFNLKAILDCSTKDGKAYLVHVDDAHTSEDPLKKELTYAIAASEKFKKIYVIFRGSINGNDWITNMQVNACDLLLPGFTNNGDKLKEKQNFGKVHAGFYEYLFGKTKRGISKGEEIMGTLAGLVQKYPGYSIIFTGHSLGGALSTLMAFRAAALNEFQDSTILNVSFASPFVGNQAFRNSFEALEQKNRIRHLRVSNENDVVPLIPFMTLTSPLLMTYKHVGMNVRLYEKSLFSPDYRIFYPKKGSVVTEVRNAIHSNLLGGINILSLPYHLCPEYTERLDNLKDKLDKITLDELYSNKNITGWSNEEAPEDAGEEKKM